MPLPRMNARDRAINTKAAFSTPGVHYGHDWFARGTRQYTYLQRYFGRHPKWPRLPSGLRRTSRGKRRTSKGRRR